MGFNGFKFQDNLLKTIKSCIEFYLNKFECNKTVFGVITNIIDLDKGIYEVKINGQEGLSCYSCNNYNYSVDDVVVILILNNNFSNKYILSKMKN